MERLVAELDEMGQTEIDSKGRKLVRGHNGRLSSLIKYFSDSNRVDYNSCFIAAQYLNEIVSKGQAANMVQKFILEVDMIRERHRLSPPTSHPDLTSDSNRKARHGRETAPAPLFG